MNMRRYRYIVLTIGLLLFGWGGKAKAEHIDSIRLFAETLEKHAVALDEQFSIACTPTLIRELSKSSQYDKESIILSELQSQVGMTGLCKIAWYDDKVELTDIEYYTGWRILCMYKSKQTSQLSSREQQTLKSALEIVSKASGSELEKERYIYDTLCQRITYVTDNKMSHGDKDCAIGALLNGKADCDGYADAMVLCCGLAGVQCRYMHGKSLKPSIDGSKDGSHMWNLVNVCGQWLMTDATWGDQKTKITYMYFNLGKNDTKDLYMWDPACVFTDIADEADFSRSRMLDQRPVLVQTMGDVYKTAREAAKTGKERIMLYCSDMLLWEHNPDTFAYMLHSGAITSYTYTTEGRFCEVTNIVTPRHYVFCDSEKDIITAIKKYAENKISSFSLYINPAIASALFANQHAGLQKVLSQSRLQDGYQYKYGAESISFTNVAFIEQLPYCSSEKDVVSLIKKSLVNRPTKIVMLLDEKISGDKIMDLVVNTVYACGVQSVSYSISGNRLSLTIKSYYDNYCLAETETDILSYLCTMKEQGTKETRVYCTEQLYTALMQNNAKKLFDLLKQAGCSDQSISYNDSYYLFMVK